MDEAQAKQKARELIQIADTSLAGLWTAAPSVIGGGGFGLTFGSKESGVAFIRAAAEWLSAATSTLSYLHENDPDAVIDQLGERVSVVVDRRKRLTDMGLDMGDPISDGMETFVKEVIRRIKAIKDNLPSGPAALGMGLVVAVVVLVIALR